MSDLDDEIVTTRAYDMFCLGYLKAVCEELNPDWFDGDVEGHLRKKYREFMAESARS